jgi:hypothetical protein
MYLCFFAFTFRHIFSTAGCFEHDSIAQQQGTGTAEGVLRASQGRLYPPWSLMLTTIVVSGPKGTQVCWIVR